MNLYLKLRDVKTTEVMEINNEIEQCVIKDRTTGKTKQKNIDHIGNLKKAETNA